MQKNPIKTHFGSCESNMSPDETTNRNTTFLQSLNPLLEFPSQTPTRQTINNTGQIAIEEAKIEKVVIDAITKGKVQSLKPNSGEAIAIGEHYICVSFHDDEESRCRVWEWHGHIMSYNEGNGYTQEYVHGNYFERTMRRLFADERDEEIDLGEFVGGMNLVGGPTSCKNPNTAGFHWL